MPAWADDQARQLIGLWCIRWRSLGIAGNMSTPTLSPIRGVGKFGQPGQQFINQHCSPAIEADCRGNFVFTPTAHMTVGGSFLVELAKGDYPRRAARVVPTMTVGACASGAAGSDCRSFGA